MSLLYEAQLALDKAHDCLDDAAFNLSNNRTIVAVNRSYYTIYYAISCLLFTENITTKTHKGAQQKFSEVFIKTGIVPLATAKCVSAAFNLRQFGDYDLEATISDSEATDLFKEVSEFYDFTEGYFQRFIRTQNISANLTTP
jgi:uncharacterized protein (UPF0332 family)